MPPLAELKGRTKLYIPRSKKNSNNCTFTVVWHIWPSGQYGKFLQASVPTKNLIEIKVREVPILALECTFLGQNAV